MLRSIHAITTYTVHATDGDIGRGHDFLCDDSNWVVRYLVAKTENWLPGRRVIDSPVFLEEPDWAGRRFLVRLTRQQIEESPPLDEHAPVSMQYEISYHQYYVPAFLLDRPGAVGGLSGSLRGNSPGIRSASSGGNRGRRRPSSIHQRGERLSYQRHGRRGRSRRGFPRRRQLLGVALHRTRHP